MKTNFLYIVFFLFILSCSKKDEAPSNIKSPNSLLMLQVDFMTNTFEGGKEYTFNSGIEDFTISTNYQAPGDFGNITLYYEELDEMLFDGSIIWMGNGNRGFPESLINPDGFQNNTSPVPMPSDIDFKNVEYSEYSYYPELINHSAIWSAINDLQLVTDYRNSNPDSNIHLFLYTPSVGIGDPNEWEWMLFLKK